MTETTFPFADVEEAPLEAEAEAGNRRVLVLAGGLVAALAVAGGAFLFLGGDDLEEEAFVAAPRAAAPPAAAEPVAAAPKLPVPFDEDLGRDPFRALYVQPAAAPAVDPADPTLPQGGTTGGDASGGGLPGGTAGVPVGSGPTTGGSTGGASTGTDGAGPVTPDAPTAREYPLVLKRVYGTGADQTAEFTIDDRKVVAKVGVRFGPTNEIRLISLQEGPKDGQWTAVLQVGDGEPFDAITGETVSVR